MPSGDMLQLIAVALSAMFLAVLLNFLLQGRGRKMVQLDEKHQRTGLPVFLFSNGILIDATSAAYAFIARRPPDVSEYDGLMQLLISFFPALPGDIARVAEGRQRAVISEQDDSLSVDILRKSDSLRITLNGANHIQALLRYRDLEQEALEKEAETLRYLCDHAPQLTWQEDDKGQVIWANKAYLTYSDLKKETTEHTRHVWPTHRLFEDIHFPIDPKATPLTKRRAIQLATQNAEHWFDVTSMPGPTGAMHFATCVNDVMRAEEAQKAFMATIANTFAQLSIGLAIFDSKRRLASYNPAFGELTELPSNFLIGRPSIEIVLDRLRDMQKLPEPKDYSSFREQFAALEARAQNGTYLENWEMPDGQTFRVTGRPHPNGALAFLFEDVTAEVSLARRFRTEIETGQSVIDHLPDAIAVFSASNMLVIANDAYHELWNQKDGSIAGRTDLRNALRIWKSDCVASSAWRAIEKFAAPNTARQAWSETVVRLDGRQLKCEISPLPNSMTLVRFTVSSGRAPTLQKLMTKDPTLMLRKS